VTTYSYTITRLTFEVLEDGTFPELKIGEGLRVVQLLDEPRRVITSMGKITKWAVDVLVEVAHEPEDLTDMSTLFGRKKKR